MKLTKDECRILSIAISDAKFAFAEKITDESIMKKLSWQLETLECRLMHAGKDKRRVGRKTHDDFTDLLKRYANKKIDGKSI